MGPEQFSPILKIHSVWQPGCEFNPWLEAIQKDFYHN